MVEQRNLVGQRWRKKFIVRSDWINAAYYLWKKQPEEKYAVTVHLDRRKREKKEIHGEKNGSSLPMTVLNGGEQKENGRNGSSVSSALFLLCGKKWRERVTDHQTFWITVFSHRIKNQDS